MLTKCKKNFATLLLSLSLTLFSTSCGNNKSKNIEIAGIKGPEISLMQDNLIISTIFENIQIDGGLRYNIPKYKYSYLEITPDVQTSGTAMNISISLKDILDKISKDSSPQKLPGGRNIPGISNGSLPAVTFSIEKFHNMSFYLGESIFAIFIPTEIGVDGKIATFRYYMNKKSAGTISIIGKDEKGENSGILLMINLTDAVKAKMLEINREFN